MSTRRLWCVFASLAVSGGLAVGQSMESQPIDSDRTASVPEPQPALLDTIWSLPVLRWFSGMVTPPPVATPVAPLTCSIQPLTAIEDPDALLMEADARLNLDGLTPRTSQALSRLETIVTARGGHFTLTSAYRPASYQAHLRDVWIKWVYEVRDNIEAGCGDLRAQVSEEFTRHSLLTSQYPVTVSDHTLGIGFDAAVAFPSRFKRRISLDRLARLAGVQRPDVRRDPVHFRLIGGRTT